MTVLGLVYFNTQHRVSSPQAGWAILHSSEISQEYSERLRRHLMKRYQSHTTSVQVRQRIDRQFLNPGMNSQDGY